MPESVSPSTLYVVATPIGNLGDLSPRAVHILQAVGVIAAEDTRHSRPLLGHFGITTPLVAYHDHNEREMTPRLLGRLEAGESVALISDAGTPLVSDPGFHLVRAARERGLRVSPVPGPSAAVCALSAAGLPADRFVFEGFLPPKEAARDRRLEALHGETRTLIFYEAGRRVLATLKAMAAAWGAQRRAVLARELTKRFETLRDGTLGELAEWVAGDPDQRRGEIVLIVAGAAGRERGDGEVEAERLLRILLETHTPRDAAALAARITGLRRNRLYAIAQSLREADDGGV